jgi:hypothetical protein
MFSIMKITNNKLIEALEKTGGYVSQAAKMLKVTPAAIYHRIDNNPEVKQVWTDIKDMKLDLAESKVIRAINNNEAWAICFYLKCQGKHRGWIERHIHEYTGKDGGPITVTDEQPNLKNLTKDELRTLQELQAKLYAKAESQN